ncbi:ParB N-terminal domain-containing protein [Nitrospira sp. Kam-Ns4a]
MTHPAYDPFPLVLVPIQHLSINPDYAAIFPALSPDAYERLKASIHEIGIRAPLYVAPNSEPGHYIILNGHHRYRIAQELHLDSIPCYLVQDPIQQIKVLFLDKYSRNLSEAERARLQEIEQQMLAQHHPVSPTPDPATDKDIDVEHLVLQIEQSPTLQQRVSQLLDKQAKSPTTSAPAAGSSDSALQAELKDREQRLAKAERAMRKLLDEKKALEEHLEHLQLALRDRLSASPGSTPSSAPPSPSIVAHYEKEQAELQTRLREISQALQAAKADCEAKDHEIQSLRGQLEGIQFHEKVWEDTHRELQEKLDELRQAIAQPDQVAQMLTQAAYLLHSIACAISYSVSLWTEAEKVIPELTKQLQAVKDEVEEVEIALMCHGSNEDLPPPPEDWNIDSPYTGQRERQKRARHVRLGIAGKHRQRNGGRPILRPRGIELLQTSNGDQSTAPTQTEERDEATLDAEHR